MAFTTLIDYSRQLRQKQGTTATFSGTTRIMGSLELGAVITDGSLVGYPYYSKFYMSSSTVTTTPYMTFSPILKLWSVTMPDSNDVTATEYVSNRFNITLSDSGTGGQFYVASQQSVFLSDPTIWGNIQNSGYHNPATVMVVGSGMTSSSTAFTVSNFASGVGKTGFTVDDSHIWLRGNTLNNVESHKTLMIGTDGQVGVNTSLRSLKQNIDYKYDSSWIYDLKPVEFEFRKFPGKIEYGFIAEDVEKTNKNLAIYESDGRLSGVKYEAVAPIILKELIELRKTIDPTFKITQEQSKVRVISSDYEVIHDGTIISRGGNSVNITISNSVSGVVRVKSLTNTTITSSRLIDEQWNEMDLDKGSSVSLLCHNDFLYILSSDGNKGD